MAKKIQSKIQKRELVRSFFLFLIDFVFFSMAHHHSSLLFFSLPKNETSLLFWYMIDADLS